MVTDHSRSVLGEELGEQVLGEPGRRLLGVDVHRADQHVRRLPGKGAYQPGHPHARPGLVGRGPAETATAAGGYDEATGTAEHRRPDRAERGGQGRWRVPVHRRHPHDAVRSGAGGKLVGEDGVSGGEHPHSRAVLFQQRRQCQPDAQAAFDDGEAGSGQRPCLGRGSRSVEQVREWRLRRQRGDLDDEPPWLSRERGVAVARRSRVRVGIGLGVGPGDDPVDDPADGPDLRQLLHNRVGRLPPRRACARQAHPLRQRGEDLRPLDRVDAQISLKI